MSKQNMRRMGASVLTAVGMGAAMVVGGGGVANAAPTSTDMTCTSANPLPWSPSFTWFVRASSGGSLPPGGDQLEPALLLSGGNDLPRPTGGILSAIGPNWYGTQVLVDWTNRNTGESGRSVSDQAAWSPNPGIPINRTFTGTGTVDFTVTIRTGGGWWFINTKNSVCQGTIDVVP